MNMQFRRSGQRDERRRRVLIEENSAVEPRSASAPSARAAGARGARIGRYSADTLVRRQPPVIALVPKRLWTLLVIAASGLSVIAALEVLYGQVALGRTRIGLKLLPALDLGSRASLAAWYGSSLLAAAAGLAVVTYFIRRHRLDDYRGRYRMWYWVVPVMILAAVDQVAGLQLTLQNALSVLLDLPSGGEAAQFWTGGTVLVGTAIAVRLTMELRECRLAIGCLSVAVVGYLTVAAARLDWLWPPGTVFRVMAVAGITLGAHLLVMLSIASYGRYVYRDAAGLIRRRPRRRRTSETTAPDVDRPRRTGKRVLRRDPPHKRPTSPPDSPSAPTETAPAARKKPTAGKSPAGKRRASSVQLHQPEPAAETDEASRKLSKAERRRLRKLRRRERRQSA